MMKLVYILWCVLLMYLTGTFIEWNLNPGNWSYGWRIVDGLFTMFCIILISCLEIQRNINIYIPERDVLIPLLNSEYFKTYFEYLDLNYIKENHRELHYVYLALKSLHEEFPDTDHSLKSLQAYFFTKYPDCDKEIYTALFENLSEVNLDPEIGSSILKQIKRRQQALKLSESAVQFATGYSSLDKVKDSAKFLEEESEEDTEEVEVVSDDLELLLNDTVTQPGLRWRLQCLNKSMGSLRKGDFGFLFARPETGKTTFLAS